MHPPFVASSSARTTPDPQLISYQTLRTALGAIGILLPAAVYLRRLIATGQAAVLPSISDYYHSVSRDFFVGGLVAIGVFLITYVGYGPLDRWVTNVGGAAAIGVAFFPIAPPDHPTTAELGVQIVHFTFAGLFFATMAFQALVLFRRTAGDPRVNFSWQPAPANRTPQKILRDRIYLVAGLIIAGCLVLMGVYALFFRHTGLADLSPLFWLETVAIEAFGVAWLVKGEMIMGDHPG